MSVISAITVVLVAAALSAVSIVVLYPVLRRYALARPNARSSHKAPTPQGGGIAVFAATIVVAGAAVHILALPTAALAAVFAATILIGGVGVIDDVRGLAVGPRLALQSLAVGLVLAALPHELRVVHTLPLAVERTLLFVGGLWFVNLVNFMDGIDWMSVAEVVPLTAGLVILGYLGALPGDGAIVAAALGGAMIGFAFFNRPVAKLFLGDVGSLPIGLLLAWLLFLVAAGGHLVAAMVMPLYYLADATITLMRRLLRGEPVWQAHRTHFYQRATDRGFTVLEIVAWVFTANICLCALAIMTVIIPSAWIGGGALAASAAIVAALLSAFTREKKRFPQAPMASTSIERTGIDTAPLRPKILYLVTEDWFFLSHFVPMARTASDAGFDVVVAARGSGRHAAIEAKGFRFIDIGSDRKSLGPLAGLIYIVRTLGLIRRERPDIVHCIALRPVVLGGIAAKLARVNGLVVAPTGLGHSWLQNNLRFRSIRCGIRLIVGRFLRDVRTRYLFENEDDPDELGLRADDPDITILGGAGVAPEDFPVAVEPPSPPLKAAVVARMIHSKGIAEATAAVRLARAQGAEVELSLFGEPDPDNPNSFSESELLSYSGEQGIHWRGRADDVARIWHEHHVALLLSRGGEGLPRSLVEAAAAGKPIITTNVPGCRDVVRDGEQGFIIAVGDSKGAASALIKLANDPALRTRMGAAARARFLLQFTEHAVTTAVRSVYLSLCPR